MTLAVASSQWHGGEVLPRSLVLRLAVVATAAFLSVGQQSLLAADSAPVMWRIDDPAKVGGHVTEVVGAPKTAEGGVRFDGVRDGLFVPVNPLQDLKAFTIEVLFSPAEDGPTEQRFWHAGDAVGSRALLEIRLNHQGGWWLDTFLNQTGKPGKALIDPKRIHPTNTWHWVALRYDGKTMTHFVNGVKELEGEVEFGPMGAGKLSLGVRQNLVHWFKGVIREMRVTPEALPEGKLQQVGP